VAIESISKGYITIMVLHTAGSLEIGKDDVPFGACVVVVGFNGNWEPAAAAELCEATLLAEG
jgi:hypothetical protein